MIDRQTKGLIVRNWFMTLWRLWSLASPQYVGWADILETQKFHVKGHQVREPRRTDVSVEA